MSEEIDASLMGSASPVPDPLSSRPKGLLDQLLDKGQISREFVMLNRTFQVSTHFQFEPSGASFFRSVVSSGDEELSEEPWKPIFHRLPEPTEPSSDLSSVRLAFARQALETHLSLCQRVEQRLEEGGGLVSTTGYGLRTSVSWGYSIGLLALVAAAAGWYGYERWRVRLPEPPSVGTVAKRWEVRAGTEPVGGEAEKDDLATETAKEETGESSAPAKGRPAPGAAAKVTKREPAPARAIRTPSPKPSPTRTKPPEPSPRAEPPPEPPREAPPPEPLPPSPTPPPKQRTSPDVPPLLVGFAPEGLRRLRLELGAQVFQDANLVVAEVPGAYRGLSCVTTTSRQGDGEQGILVRLSRPAQVYVAHDLKVEKRPRWLEEFQTRGDRVQVMDLDKGRVHDLQVYYRRVQDGAAAMGSNTGARKLTKKIRGFVPTNSLLMYLVCVREDGQ